MLGFLMLRALSAFAVSWCHSHRYKARIFQLFEREPPSPGFLPDLRDGAPLSSYSDAAKQQVATGKLRLTLSKFGPETMLSVFKFIRAEILAEMEAGSSSSAKEGAKSGFRQHHAGRGPPTGGKPNASVAVASLKEDQGTTGLQEDDHDDQLAFASSAQVSTDCTAMGRLAWPQPPWALSRDRATEVQASKKKVQPPSLVLGIRPAF